MNEALMVHKDEMKKLVIAGELAAKAIPATDDSMAGIGIRQKLLS